MGARRLSVVTSAATLAALVAVVMWASHRGFDIADESFYLNGYAHPQRGPVATQYDALVSWATGPFNLGIVGYRVSRLVVLLGSSAFLGWGLHRFAVRRLRPSLADAMPPKSVTVISVTIAGLLGYSWLPQTLSYNDLTAALLYSQGACLLVAAADLTDAVTLPRRAALLVGAVGALGAVLTFVKYPSEIVFAVALIAAGGVLLPRSVRWRALACLIGGALVGVVALASGPASVRALAESQATEAYTPRALLRMYWTFTQKDLPRAVSSGALRIAALVGLFWATPLLAHDDRRERRLGAFALATLCAGFVVGEIVYLASRGEGGYAFGKGYFGFLHHADLIITVLVAGAIAAVLARFTRSKRPGARRSPALAAAAGLAFWIPLSGAAGTGNPPLEQTTVFAAGFGCLVVLAAAWITEAVNRRGATPWPNAGLAVVGVALGAQAAIGLVRHPYDLPRNLRHQSETVAASPTLGGVGVDPPTATMLRQLTGLLRDRTTVTRRHLLIAPWSGHQYALGMESAFNGWPDKGRTGACRSVLGTTARIRQTAVVLDGGKRTREHVRCLRAVRPAYDTEFVEIGRFDVPALPGIRLPEPVVVRVRQDLLK